MGLRTFGFILFCAVVVGCDVFSPGSGGPNGLWIGQTGVVMDPGEEFTFTARFQEHGIRRGRASSPIEPATEARWWTNDTDVIRLPSASGGTVEALAPGSATVWVELGSRRDSTTVTVLGANDQPTHRWKAVATWMEGICALDEAGHAYCWGDDLWGGWGTGHARRQWTYAYRPVRVNTMLAFEEIGKGTGFACARTAAGEVWCWGLHHGDQLGHGRTGVDYETGPVRVQFRGRAVSLGVGGAHACLLDDTGKAHCWGSNLSYELGIEDNATSSREFGGRTVPVAFDGSFAELYVNAFMSCGLTAGSDLYCWGRTHGGSPAMGQVNQLPSRIAAPVRPYRVSPGNGASSFLSKDGHIYSWGHTALTPTGYHQSPIAAETSLRFAEVVRFCALDTGGEAWCWGSGAAGIIDPNQAIEPCGPPSTDECSPDPVRIPGGHRFKTHSVSLAACGVTTEGELYCWGDNEWGQLGIGRPGIEKTHIPQRVLDPL